MERRNKYAVLASGNDAPFFKKQAALGRMSIDRGKNVLGSLAFLKPSPELQQCRCVRSRFTVKINAHETTDRLTVVESVFCPFVRQSEALLGNVHAQHPLQTNRRVGTTFATRMLNLLDQLLTASIQLRKRSRRVIFLRGVFLV
jgi:hypothetical protein